MKDECINIQMHDGRWIYEQLKMKEEYEDWENTNPKWFITQQPSLNGCIPDMPHQPYLIFSHPS